LKYSHKSLDDVHESVDVTAPKSRFRKFLAFIGPAYLISVGYMDPGNWATDLAGGSQFGYALIWVLLMSNIMALLLQSLCARLGIVRGKDLAQCNRESYPKGLNYVLYVLAEIAIAACDLAEVLGMAIGLQLLFGLDLIWGVLISFLDTFLLLYLQRFGIRKLELFIIGLVFMIGMCFMVEMFFAQPDPNEIVQGFVPSIPDETALYIAIGIIGATVMPHNLYLHSALVQTRKIPRDVKSIKRALRINFLDSAVALNLAFLVNAAILILAASAFFKNGMTNVAELEDAHELLYHVLGTEWAPRLFAVALILAGQSSTVTGTLAGQIVMEGYLHLRINPILRRLLTRMLAIVPAVVVILVFGESEVGKLLIFSQVLLSMQLAFAVVPLIYFVSNKQKMGQFAIKLPVKIAAWTIAGIISVLNLKLVYEEMIGWMNSSGSIWVNFLAIALGTGMLLLLLTVILYPVFFKWKDHSTELHPPFEAVEELNLMKFKRIAVALDFSDSDVKALQYVMNFAQKDTVITLIHVVESVSARMAVEGADDYETRNDEERLKRYAELIQNKGFTVQYRLGYKNRIREIARIIEETGSELLILGSHGHRGFMDFIYGETISKIHHKVKVPVFIAK